MVPRLSSLIWPLFASKTPKQSSLLPFHFGNFLLLAAGLQNMVHEEETTFFERERDRLSKDITLGFEELLSSTNVINRKLEEVLGMTKEYDTIASLWHSFYELMRNSGQADETTEEQQPGLPGTGGHVVAPTK